MKRRILTLTMLLLTAIFTAEANPVDMRTAREVAVKFMNANSKVPLSSIDDLQLVTTYSISRGNAAFHIFNTPNGFIIVSADDCATPILGYSNEGQFEVENIPIQLQDIFRGYVEQIQYGIENHLNANEQTAQQWELVRTIGRLTNNRTDEVVEPLLSTTWGQSYPYNMYAPNGYPTGCVATAMAQIMKYWEWPIQGIGEHSYQWNGQTLSANFEETTYDWSNMLNYHNYQSTQEQNEAVATLMWHCGVSVNMNYASGGSSAYLYPSSLIDYFNYSDDLHLENREDDESWITLLKTDLDLGHPIYYVGSRPNYNEAHAFVCDGYDANDRFHFNWGWNGSSNGYFVLNDIDYYGWNYAIFNLHPNAPSVTRQVTASASPSDGGLVTGAGMYDIGSICTLTATANEGYTFMYWTEDDEVVSSHAEYSFCVRKDRDLVAHFGTPFPIGVVIDPEGGGTVSGVGEYDYGSTCTLTATANEGYDFICWRRANGSVASTASSYSFTVTEATTLTAVFAVSGGEQIAFADLNVKALCVANWDNDGDGELSYSEAAAVTDLGLVFRNKTTITSFEELQYFTGLTTIGNSAFEGCRKLSSSLCIPNSVTTIGDYAFRNCSGFTGDLNIPNSVITIGDYSFNNCSGFTGDLNIPNSVTTIGVCAFESCSGFTGNLTLGNSVNSIGNYAFSGCSGFTGSLSIPNSVISLGYYAFYNCNGFTGSLTLGNSVTIIGDNAFNGCSGFTGSLIIPNSVTEIRGGAFYNCNGFTGNLIIGNSVTTIGGNAFMKCSGFTGDLIIPDSVISIGYFAFQDCSGFTGDLIIGNSVTTIGGRVFVGCTGFTGNLVLGNSMTTIGNAAFSGCSGFTGSLTIPNSVTTIGNIAFSGCSGFTGSLTIPDSVTTIGYDAFYGCSGFTGSLTIGNSVTTIGSSAFYNCSGFTGDLIIPNSVTSIGGYAFYNCSGFTGSLTIPNSVATIGNSAFYNCSGFTGSLTIGNSVTTIGNYAFYGCSGFTGDLTIPDSVTTIDYNTFYNCSGFTGSLTIGNSVTTIGSSAFYNCSGFTGSLTIPNSVTSIGGYAFYNCSGFTGSLTIPSSVTSIGGYTFYNCSDFSGNLTIPSSVTTIGSSAFYNCRGLSSLIVLAETPPTLGDRVFNNVNMVIPVYVPCESEVAYTSVNWGGFSNCIGMCGGMVTVIADSDEGGTVTGGGSYEAGQACTVMATANEGYVFANWTQDGIVASNSDAYTFYVTNDMTLMAHFVPEGNIVFADANVKSICVSHWDTNSDGELSYAEAASVTSLGEVFRGDTEITSFDELQYFIGVSRIDDNAFRDCTGLTSLPILPNSVNSIGNFAFYGCSGMTGSITILDFITSIGNGAFYGCSSLNGSLIISNSVTSIGYTAFRDCSGLTGSLTIPNSVTSIGYDAFRNCSSLTGSLTIPNSVTSIGNGAFWDCSGLNGSLTISNSVTSIGHWTFQNCSGLLGSLTIPNSVTYIGNSAFRGCSGLTGSLIIPDAVTIIDHMAFSGCSGFTGSLTIGSSVTTIGNYAFSGCSGFTGSLTIGNSVASIGIYAFSGCSGFTGGLAIGDSMTTISDGTFQNCSGFTGSLTISNSVTSIGNSAFFNCSGFTGDLTIPNSVTTINNYAFYNCSGFTGSLTLGNSVTTIGSWAFENCRNFTSMYVFPETPPTAVNAFYSGLYGIPVYVPCGSLEAYQEASGWSNFTNYKEDCIQTQTITLSQGPNWFSTYLDITLDDLKAALVAAIPANTTVTIKNATQNTLYSRGQWNGTLDWDVAKMYKIIVPSACEITLEGMPLNPAEHPITIVGGGVPTWIGFPFSESMTLTNAFAGFAQDGDIVKSSSDNAQYARGLWNGQVTVLEPGKGYLYISAPTVADRTLTFPTGSK